jgi:hypothetical protein
MPKTSLKTGGNLHKDPIYCVKQKKFTENDGEGVVTSTKRGQPMLKIPCAECGMIKTTFLKK